MKPNKLDSQLISILEKHKSELKTRFNVESLSIFGSFSRGTAGPESDLDILVRFIEPPGFFGFLELKEFLEQIVGRPVDLVTEKALKKQLREQILMEAQRVA